MKEAILREDKIYLLLQNAFKFFDNFILNPGQYLGLLRDDRIIFEHYI